MAVILRHYSNDGTFNTIRVLKIGMLVHKLVDGKLLTDRFKFIGAYQLGTFLNIFLKFFTKFS